MSRRTLMVLVVGVLALVGFLLFGPIHPDLAALALVVIAAPAQTAFALIYGFGSPWWRSLIGRALFTKAVALALLIDISLAYQWLGDDYYFRDAVRLLVFTLIAVGAWMQLIALLKERHDRRTDDDRFGRRDESRTP